MAGAAACVGWHCWDGTRWAVDEQRADVEAAVATLTTALGELDRLDGPERTALFKDVRKAEAAMSIDGMVRIASALPPISTRHGHWTRTRTCSTPRRGR